MNQPDPATPEVPQVQAQPEPVEVRNLHEFVQRLVRWHNQRVTRLVHLLEIPDGAVMQLDQEPEITITGDARKAFIIGVNLALQELGKLPFSYEVEDAAPPAANDEAPPAEVEAANG